VNTGQSLPTGYKPHPDEGLSAVDLWEARDAAAFVATRRPKRYPVLGPNGFYDTRPFASEHDFAEIATAILYLQHCIRTKTPTAFSYGLKHRVEGWGRRRGYAPYVSNGALIAAALYLGVKVKPLGEGNPNAFIGVSRRSVRWLERM
jgi:hypothetical protein